MEQSAIQIITLISQYIIAAILLYAAIMDIKTYTIENWISVVIIALFPIILFLNQGLEFSVLFSHLGTGLVMLLVGAGLFASGAFGGGDAKLIAAISVWLGWKPLMPFLLIMSFAGGLLTLVILLIRKLNLFKDTKHEWLQKMREKDRGIPYGVAISIAGIFFFIMNN
jgi:prepilin peptidase CpaA